MKTELIDIETLIPDPHNARKHNVKNLSAVRGSIKQFGIVEPLVVRRENNVVIGGNGRLQVLKDMGVKKVPVHYLDIDETKAKALALALNRSAELAEWEDSILKESLAELSLNNFDIESIGFDTGDFDLFGDPDKEKKKSDEKHCLEITFPDRESLEDEYNSLCERGLIVKIK